MIRIFAQKRNTKEYLATKKNLDKLCRSQTKFWVDLENPTKAEADLVSNAFKLHPLVREDLFSSKTPMKLETHHRYMFLVAYGLKMEDTVRSTEFDFILGKHFVISNHRAKLKEYHELMKRMDILSKRLGKGVDFMLHKLLDILVDDYFPVLEKIEDMVENLEEEAIKNPNRSVATNILHLKRRILAIRRTTFGMREQMGQVIKHEGNFLSKSVKNYLRDVNDHVMRASEQIDSYRELLVGAHDAYNSALSNKMNEIMKVLSIISTIMLPLAFMTGLYGMNFKFMPGLTNPVGFWIMILAMLILSILMMIFFRSRKWI